jgi:hypothetical protein
MTLHNRLPSNVTLIETHNTFSLHFSFSVNYVACSAGDIEISKRLSPESRSVVEEFMRNNQNNAFKFMK